MAHILTREERERLAKLNQQSIKIGGIAANRLVIRQAALRAKFGPTPA